MKANELAVGDWAFSPEMKQPITIKAILEHNQVIFAQRITNDISNRYLRNCSEIEPIPLTPEILEKNRFRIDEENKWKTRYAFVDNLEKTPQTVVQFSFYEDSCSAFSLFECWTKPYSCDGENSIHICDLKFVHELQHALRLCGIDKEIVI